MHESKINISQVAKILNTTQLNILMHIKRGLLKGSEENGGWMIEKASLDNFMEKNGESKAADVCASGCAQKHACGGGCS
ncbi:MAG: hypothetical protein GWN30_11305 [Gammaproteobacteria bacterium]|nr:hypothetical protein [Gammaproteobacteria bacterium]NIW98216.1 hypothetical protein [Phycisphaerae bacterium]